MLLNQFGAMANGIQVSGKKFLELRTELLLPQEEFARKVRKSKTWVSNLENSVVSVVYLSTFRLMVEGLGIPADTLKKRLMPDKDEGENGKTAILLPKPSAPDIRRRKAAKDKGSRGPRE